MMVSTGAEWFTDKGEKRIYSIALDDQDLIDLRGQEFFEGLDFNAKRKALNNACDAMVVAYMAQEGAIDPKYARERIEALRSG